jgi:hypothetical protein
VEVGIGAFLVALATSSGPASVVATGAPAPATAGGWGLVRPLGIRQRRLAQAEKLLHLHQRLFQGCLGVYLLLVHHFEGA